MATDKSSDTKRVSEPADLPPSVYGGSPAAATPASAQPVFTTTIVIERVGKSGRKKRKYTRGTKPMQEFLFGVSKSGFRVSNSLSKGLQTFVRNSRKSSRKKRDGMIRDSLRNASRGVADGFEILGKAPWDVARRIPTRRVWRAFRILTPFNR